MAKLDSKRSWCTLTNTQKPTEQVSAQFNPNKISISKNVTWNEHKGSKGDLPTLEFTNAEAEKLTVDLFFDTYEEKKDVYQEYVESLRAMTLVDQNASGEDKRPPLVMLTWGDKKFLKFTGVIASLNIEYTMFLPDGTPVRATCKLTLQQTERATAKVKKKGGGGGESSDGAGPDSGRGMRA